MRFLFSLALLAAPALGQDLCEGRVQDKAPRSIQPRPLPPLGQVYVDPAFGTPVTRITDVSPAEGANAVIKPMYSTIQAWNADESRLILWHRGVGHELYDGQTYQFLKVLNLTSPTDLEQILWDPVYPNLLFYPSNYNAQQIIYVHDVEQNVSAPWIDMAAEGHCPAGDWGALIGLGADPSGVSFGTYEPVVGMRCGSTMMLVNLWRRTVLPVFFPGTVAPMAAPLGQRFYYPGYPGAISFGLFFDSAALLNLTNPGDHGSVGSAYSASNAWYSVVFEEASETGPASIVRTNLVNGVKKVIVGQANGWPYPPGGAHLSAISRAIGWVAASAVGAPEAAGSVPLHQEVFLANSDTGQVCRLAHHRSLAGEGSWGYWAEPHVSISPSGTRMLFGSDWGGGATVNTFVIDLR